MTAAPPKPDVPTGWLDSSQSRVGTSGLAVFMALGDELRPVALRMEQP